MVTKVKMRHRSWIHREVLPILRAALILSFTFILPFASALRAVPGSNCTTLCSHQGSYLNTTTDEITCYDKDYNDNPAGVAFKTCVACEIESELFNPTTRQTDLGWALCK